jgi:hypothetical protein
MTNLFYKKYVAVSSAIFNLIKDKDFKPFEYGLEDNKEVMAIAIILQNLVFKIRC